MCSARTISTLRGAIAARIAALRNLPPISLLHPEAIQLLGSRAPLTDENSSRGSRRSRVRQSASTGLHRPVTEARATDAPPLSSPPDSTHIGRACRNPPTSRRIRPKKPKDYARPTRAKAHRPDAPAHDPALDDLLNPGIGRGRAGMGSGTGPAAAAGQFLRPARRSPPRNTPRARRRPRASRRSRKAAMSRARRSRAARQRARSGAGEGTRARARRECRNAGRAGRQAAREKSTTRSISAAASPAPPPQRRAGKSAARGPRGIQRADLGAASPAAAGEIRRRHPLRDQERAGTEGRPADRDPGTGRGRRTATTARRCCSASPAPARPTPWRR